MEIINKILSFFSGWKIYVAIGLIVLGTVAYIGTLRNANKELKGRVETLTSNLKAEERGTLIWKDKYGQEHAKTLLFKETMTSFKNSQDSLTRVLRAELEKTNVQLKNVKQAIYQNTHVDTVLGKSIYIPTMPDTTFDLSNEHLTNIIRLSPTSISSQVAFEDKLIGTLSAKKETIDPPKKFFLCRWFQKKHTVIEADLFHTNPLIKTKAQKIIQIQD